MKIIFHGKLGERCHRKGLEKAFTLIELLTVIAIIGVLAGVLLGISGLAGRKMREIRMNGDMQNIITGIETYKSDLGYYPPDNGNPYTSTDVLVMREQERIRTMFNPLFYELSGCTFKPHPTTPRFQPLNRSDTVKSSALEAALGVSGIANSGLNKLDVKYRAMNFKPSQYGIALTNLGTPADEVILLTVPIPAPATNSGWMHVFGKEKKFVTGLNVWRYDSSSTNRNNRNGYDLWCVVQIGDKAITNGNWKTY